jgi:TetR/AcrR family transcriptional regulator, transcriptional repressor for nem operon
VTKKEEIIDTAAKLVYLKGFNSTSIDDVLTESGAGKGQFYYYFDSKETLGYAIIDRQFQTWKEQVLDRVFSQHRGLDAVDTFFRETYLHVKETGCRGGCPFGNMAQEHSDSHEGFRKKVLEIFQSIIHRFESAYKEAKASGELRDDVDCYKAAEFTFSTIQGALLLAKTGKEARVIKDAHESLNEYLGALKRR